MPTPIPSGIRHRSIRAFAAALIFFFAAGLGVHAASTWRPLSDTRTNNGVWMASATVGWAVGDEGLISQTTDGGTTWTAQSSGVVVNLNAVWGVDASNVWAVGDAGTILKYNGTSWAAQTSPVTQNLNAIHGVSASAIWAVGQTATIVKFNGTSWATQSVSSGGGQKPTLQGVWAADATNVWAVGTSGKILKIGTPSWTYQTSGTSNDLFAVWGTSATNILAVGQSGTVRLSNNGTSWAADPANGVVSTTLRGISGTDASNVWIVGDGGVARFYNGSGGFTAQSSNSTQALNAVSAFSTTSVMAVGTGKTFDHFGGTTWSAQASPVPSSNFAGVWASDDNNVWFAGPGGAMMLWNGTTFTLPLTGVAVVLNDVWGADPNNVWAVAAGGTIIKWNGAAWSTQISGTTQALNSVSGTSATDVWAVGASGTILHFNGTSWSTKTSGTTQPLNGVWAASATAAWTVGNAGVILKWNGSTWAAQASGTTQSLNEVQGASATAVWAVGAAGTILKYSGSTWAAQASGTGTALSALAVVNSTTLWAAGGTTILRGTGTTWATDGVTGLPNGVLAAWATGANTVFLSTQSGLIFTNSPAAVPEIGVEQPAGTKLNNNQSTVSFGTVTTPATSTLTFTITSSGNADLTGLAITKDGTNAAEFTVSTLATTTLATGTTTTFDVTFTPATEGTRTANLHIASNDLDEPAFNIALTGVGQLPVTITTQPVSKTVNPNLAATFSAAATGTKPLSYQWQKFNTMTTRFEDITGATGTSYAIAKALESDQGDYRVVVTNPAGSVDSNTATLGVNDPVAIVAPLIASQTAAMGATVTFTVNATGTETKKYQWRKNGINLVNSSAIAGATSATLTLTNTQLIHAGVYSVLVSNMVNSQLSTSATLTVIDATAKTLKLPTLGKATIVASYTGTPTTFLWQKDGGALPMDFRYTVVKNVLTITTLQVAPFTDAGVYTCAITGPDGGSVTCTTTLIVYSLAPEITGSPPTMPDAMVGDPTYTYQIPFDSNPLKTPTSFIASGLPAGLKCNALTGLITGKPAVALTADKTYVVTLTAANAKNKSVKTANLLLKALPAASVGIFTGPIVRQNPLNRNLGGRFDLTATTTGSFTGKVTLGALAYSFSGALVSDVTGVNAPAGVVLIKRTLPPNLNITFTMDLANHALTSCDVNDGTNHASFSAWRKRWGTVMPLADLTDLKTYLGYYTFGLDPAVPVTVSPITAAEVQPQGMGYGSFTVASTGLLTAAGKLPDNTAWSCATFCGPHGEVLVYQALYSSLGSIVGSLDITQGTVGYVPSYGDNTLGGTLTWLRPATATHVYKTGFGPINVTALGGRYVAPAAPALLFGVTDDNVDNNAHVVFTDGGISSTSTDSTGTQIPPDVNVRIKAGGSVFVPAHSSLIVPDPNPRSTTLAITQSSGYFTGKATLVDSNPAVANTNITRTPYYYGLIIRDGSVMRGYGFFLLPRRPGLATQTVLTTDQLSGQVVLEKSP